MPWPDRRLNFQYLPFALEAWTKYNVPVIGIDRVDGTKLAKVSRLLVDIDDTLSTRGKLAASAYTALWQLHDAGVELAVVTGRPAG